MSHRCYLENLDQTLATKATIAGTFHEVGFKVTLDAVNVVRPKGRRVVQGQHCSAFVTMGTAEEVAAAVQALDGRVVLRLSERPLSAQVAVPSLTTLVQTPNEPKSSEPSAGSCVQMVVGQLTKAKKEIQDNLQTEGGVIENPGLETVSVNQEVFETMSSEPSNDSSVHVAVSHFRKVKKEDVPFKDEPPWKRRTRLREADVVG